MVYRFKNFYVYDAGNSYIVHNKKLNFKNHHTHINNYDTCKYIIQLAYYKTVPKHLSDYLLVSLIRISDDEEYINKLYNLLLNNRNKRNNKNYYMKGENRNGKYVKSKSSRYKKRNKGKNTLYNKFN